MFFKESFMEKVGRSNKFFFIATVAAIAFAPPSVFAQIIISEFLYDAEGSDADQEFVELFNAGTLPIDLTGWKINDGSNHTLNVPPKNGGTGSMSIAPGAYVLLVDDAAAFIPLHSGIFVSIIDTVLSLPNTAGTISLIDGEGTTVNSISYTKDNGGAGDGNSLARTNVSGTTLKSVVPTPGTGSFTFESGNSSATNSTAATTSEDHTDQTTSTGKVSSGSFVAPPETQLFADGGNDRAVIVGADVEFVGRAYNRKKEPVNHAHLVWNFGDGSTAEGAKVFHHYDYPGRYLVVLDIAESENPASDQIIITAEKAQMTFMALPDGSVSIENHSKRTLDLSHWIVRQQLNFVLPDNSRVLAGASMHIAQRTLGFTSSSATEFLYPNGVVALRAGESTEGTTAAVAVPLVIEEQAPAAPTLIDSENAASDRDGPPPVMERNEESNLSPEPSLSDTEEVEPSTQVAAAATAAGTSYRWWWGVGGLTLLAAGALLAARRFSKREWDIEEMEETR